MLKPSELEGQEITYGNARYHFYEKIGSGGFAHVYRAVEKSELKRNVAIKVLRAKYADVPLRKQRFREEATTLSQISGEIPRIVRYLDYVDGDNAPHSLHMIIMDWLEGQHLHEWLRSSHGDFRDMLEIAQALCALLRALHYRYYVHGDLSPSNILVTHSTDVDIRIIDFGLSYQMPENDDAPLPERAEFGNPSYMAPELVDDQRVCDEIAEIFSLGAVYYLIFSGTHYHPELVDYFADVSTGNVPTDVDRQALRRMMADFVPEQISIASVSDDVSDAINALVFDMLKVDRHARMQTVQNVQVRIEEIANQYIQGISAEIRPDAMLPKSPRPISEEDGSQSGYGVMYSLNKIPLYDVPLSIGTCWGLNRGSFVGVLACVTSNWGMKWIIQAEQMLYDCTKQDPTNELLRELPKRYWLEVDWEAFPSGPNTLDDILEYSVDTQVKEYLSEHGLSTNQSLGLVITVKTDGNISDSDKNHLGNWIRRVYDTGENSLFDGTQVAIIINVVNSLLKKAADAASDLVESLNTQQNQRVDFRQIPIEGMFTVPNAPDESEVSIDFRRTIGMKRGFSYCQLLHFIDDAFSEAIENDEDRERIDRLFSAYIDFATEINYEPQIEQGEPIRINMRGVVQDMDYVAQNVSNPDRVTDSDLLTLVRDYTPYLLYDLIEAYARSSAKDRRSVLIETLLFALNLDNEQDSYQFQVDSLVDSWLEGIKLKGLQDHIDEYSIQYMTKVRQYRNPNKLHIPFLLALLRFGLKHQQVSEAIEVFKAFVATDVRSGRMRSPSNKRDQRADEDNGFANFDTLEDSEEQATREWSFLPDALADIVQYVSNTNQERLLRRYHGETLHYAARARLVPPPLSYLRLGGVDIAEVWWWVLSQNLVSNYLVELSTLPIRLRAVLGMITLNDWNAIQDRDHDSDVLADEKLVACRRKRPLYFHSK